MNRALTTVKHACAIGFVVILVAVAASNFGVHLPGWPDNPFRDRVVDHSQDPIALQLVGIQEFHAARGTFSVIVDLEHDTAYVPSFLAGSKATMAATGVVDVSVDFAGAQVDATDTTVTVHLPAPTFAPVALDHSKTKVVARERGLFERYLSVFQSSPTNDEALYQAAVAKIGDAATSTDLVGMAKTQVRQMVTVLVAPRTALVMFADDQTGPVYGPGQ